MVKVEDDLVRIGVDRTEEEEKVRLHTAAHQERECVAEHPGRQEGQASMHSPLDSACSLLPLPGWLMFEGALQVSCL